MQHKSNKQHSNKQSKSGINPRRPSSPRSPFFDFDGHPGHWSVVAAAPRREQVDPLGMSPLHAACCKQEVCAASAPVKQPAITFPVFALDEQLNTFEHWYGRLAAVQADDVEAPPTVPSELQAVPGSAYAYPAFISAISNAVVSEYDDNGAKYGFTQLNGIVVPVLLHVPPFDPVAVALEFGPHCTDVPTGTIVDENVVPFDVY